MVRPGRFILDTDLIRVWVDPGAGLEAGAKRKIPCPCGN
jgi:hypothetical protein